MGKFVVKHARSGVIFTLVTGGGEIIGVSGVYQNRPACLKGVEQVRHNAPAANVEDQTQGEEMPTPKFELYQDKKGEYRFHLKAEDGETILSSEGYPAKDACRGSIASVVKNAPDAVLVEGN